MKDKLEFTTDNAEYEMRLANAMTAWRVVKNALSVVGNVDLSKGGKVEEVILKTILASLGSNEFKELENLIFKNTYATVNGEKYNISSNLDGHFNKCRGDIIEVLTEGFKFQFVDFLPSTMKSLIK